MLGLLYVKIRQDMSNPGMGLYELTQLLDRPREQMEFHLWYLKEKGWIRRTEDGLLAITADGVDKVHEDRKRSAPVRRITDQSGQSVTP